MINIISHRGFWNNQIKKNSLESFNKSLSLGFGIETDFRDFNGGLVISHDVPKNDFIDSDRFFKLLSSHKNSLPVAINIKSDGLQELLMSYLKKFNIENYFVFDMSIPDTINYIDSGFNVFTRQSEIEKNPIFYNESTGIWLDCFDKIWYDRKLIYNHLSNGKYVAIVSSELHKRDFIPHWKLIKDWNLHTDKRIILCTDYPTKAKDYFNKEL